MEEQFTLEVLHNNKEYGFDGRLVISGYHHRFLMFINGFEVVYEPDEERNYRAVLKENDFRLIKEQDIVFFQLVAEKLAAIRG